MRRKSGNQAGYLAFQLRGHRFGGHGVAEHSSVMSMLLISFYISNRGGWLPCRRNDKRDIEMQGQHSPKRYDRNSRRRSVHLAGLIL